MGSIETVASEISWTGSKIMGKGQKKALNPADAFRKEERKKELAKNKKRLAAERERQELFSNPEKLREELGKLQRESDENRLDKGLKEKIKEVVHVLDICDLIPVLIYHYPVRLDENDADSSRAEG